MILQLKEVITFQDNRNCYVTSVARDNRKILCNVNVTPISYTPPSLNRFVGICEVFNYTVTNSYLVLRPHFATGAVYQHLAQQTGRCSKEVSLYLTVSRVEIRNCGLGVKAIIVHLHLWHAVTHAHQPSTPLPPQKTPKQIKNGVETSTRLPRPGRVIIFHVTQHEGRQPFRRVVVPSTGTVASFGLLHFNFQTCTLNLP